MMGTNFYLFTQNRETKNNYFGGDYTLTEYPNLGYELHIAKTSHGWLPLFRATETIKSVKDIQKITSEDDVFILDEYGERYSCDKFNERVIKFNGGTKGAIDRKLIDGEYIPISHLEYHNGENKDRFYIDEDGYEFSIGEFS